MKYRLVTTKQGQFPINEIKEGTEVFCSGNWIKAPSPVMGEVITCKFKTLPTTSFERKFVENKNQLYCNREPILNKFEKDRIGLSVRGYLHETRKKNSAAINLNKKDLSYWYARLIDFFGYVVYPNFPNSKTFTVYEQFPKLEELYGNELSEKNLEYYLEGILRKKMLWQDSTFKLPDNLDETDKIVLRLLNIDCYGFNGNNYLGTAIANPCYLLRHIKDDYNKSRITDEQIKICMLRSYELTGYSSGYVIDDKIIENDWILPRINPDVNCLNPVYDKDTNDENNPMLMRNTHIYQNPTDSLGKEYKKCYLKENLWEKYLNS